jgi:phosphatidate phosphatase LPIN
MIGRDWTHLGVAKLYTDIVRNGYKIMYLTSRAIGQADATRDYLKGIKQENYQLPEGPVIMSPDRLMASLHRYVLKNYLISLAHIRSQGSHHAQA